jgi:hypothetical protein
MIAPPRGQNNAHDVEDGVMATAEQAGVIEISEEAYKQNTVYRPWADILWGETKAGQEKPLPEAAQNAPPGAS